MKPLAVDLACGLGGWTEGLLAEGWDVLGFDIERHHYGDAKYPAQLVLQDVLTMHGSQFKDAALIVASPPCQEFSYMAMPWSRAKEKARKLENDPEDRKRLTALFDACFRIQREAIEAAGHFIPLVVENVRGAQRWVGRAKWHYGSYYLWGDVPVLMPIVQRFPKDSRLRERNGHNVILSSVVDRVDHTRNNGGSWFAIGSPGQKVTGMVNKRDGHSHTRHLTNQREHDAVHALAGIKQAACWCLADRELASHVCAVGSSYVDKMLGTRGPAMMGSKSKARKAASAQIAKIPLRLSRHIAAHYRPNP